MARKTLHAEDIVEDNNKDKDVPETSVNPTTDVPVTSVNHIIGPAKAKRVAVDGKILHSSRHPCTDKEKGILRVNSQSRRQLGSSHRCHKRRVGSSRILRVNSQTRRQLGSSQRCHGRRVTMRSVNPSTDVPMRSVNLTADVPVTSVNHIIGPAKAKRVAMAGKTLHSARLPCTDKGKEILGVNPQRRFKFCSSHRCSKRSVNIAASEEDRPSCSKYGSLSTPEVVGFCGFLSTPEVNKLQDALNPSSLSAGVTDPLPQALGVAERVASDMATEDIVEDGNKDKDFPATPVNPTTIVPVTSAPAQAKRVAVAGKIFQSVRHPCTDNGKGILRVNSQTRRQLGSSHRFHGRRVTIADSVGEPSCGNYGSLSTPEVKKVQDALKSSVADLKAAVTDPLPEALEVAERVASYMAGKNLHTKSIVEEGNMDTAVPATSVNPMDSTQAQRLNLHAKPVEKDNSNMDKSVPPPSFATGREPAQAKDANLGNQASFHQSRVPRPSLTERNGTAHTYEWEDSIDVSARGTTSPNRCHLPSPNVKHVSPMKEQVNQKWLRRRDVNRWSLLEEEALRKGVNKYGRKWKRILNSNPDAFNPVRTGCDLKDKWRNLQARLLRSQGQMETCGR